MSKFCSYYVAVFMVFSPSLVYAQGATSTGTIAGIADPGSQIVVTGLDNGAVIGVMAACDGAYKAENLKPGRYSIVEGGLHHAVRKLSVNAGSVSHVDLGAPTSDSTQACNDKPKSR